MAQIVGAEPERPSLLRPDLHPQLEVIVMRAMKKKGEDRYATMSDFAAALGHSAEADSGPRTPVNRVKRLMEEVPRSAQDTTVSSAIPQVEKRSPSRKRGWIWVAVAGLAAAMLAGGIFLSGKNKDGRGAEGRNPVIPESPDQPKENDPPAKKPDADPKPADKALLLKEPAEVKPPRLIKAHTDSLSGVAFSPDGKTLATCSGDKTIRLWNVADGERKGKLDPDSKIWCLAFSPDGKTLAAGGPDKKVTLWNVAEGEATGTIETGDVVELVAFAPGGSRLTTSTGDFGRSKNYLKVWDVETKKLVGNFNHGAGVTSVSFSRDGKLWATSGYTGICLWNAATGAKKDTFLGHEGRVMYAAFRPDDKALVSIGADKTVRIWDAKTGNFQKPVLAGHTRPGHFVSYTANGRLILSTTEGGGIFLWDPSTKKHVIVREDSGNPRVVALGKASYLALSPDGKTLACKKGNDVLLFDLGQYWDNAEGK